MYTIELIEDIAYNNRLVTEGDLKSIIIHLQDVFNNQGEGETGVSDECYDILYGKYRSMGGLDIIGAPVDISRKTLKHNYPDLRGTLDKVHFIKDIDKDGDVRASIESWMSSVKRSLGTDNIDWSAKVSPKWDGNSVILECDDQGYVERALTRGDVDTNEAVDLTHIFGGFKLIYKQLSKVGVKCEVVMNDDQFKLACEQIEIFKNKRSAVSGILNNKYADKGFVKYITIIPISIQDNDGMFHDICEYFDTLPFTFVDMVLDAIFELPSENTVSFLSDIRNGKFDRDVRQYLTDGVVITLTNNDIQKKLGRKSNINKFEFAYKFKADSTKSKILDIVFSVGSSGTLTPVAKIEPVILKGNTIKSINMGSTARFTSLGLAKGDEVIIEYEIIPYLRIDDSCIKSGNPIISKPSTCPSCGGELTDTAQISCINPECLIVKHGRIVNYLEKMSIPNISDATVAQLMGAGIISRIEDLYRINNKEVRGKIEELSGFGKKKFANMISSIYSRVEVLDSTLLGAMGIPLVGRKMFNKILNIYYIDELQEIASNKDVSKLTKIEGVGDKVADAVIEGLKNRRETIEFLRSEIKIKDTKLMSKDYKLNVCFTGVRDKEFEKYLDTIGVKVQSSYSKKTTDFLIVKSEDATTSKIAKALADGKEVVLISKAYLMFGYNTK